MAARIDRLRARNNAIWASLARFHGAMDEVASHDVSPEYVAERLRANLARCAAELAEAETLANTGEPA